MGLSTVDAFKHLVSSDAMEITQSDLRRLQLVLVERGVFAVLLLVFFAGHAVDRFLCLFDDGLILSGERAVAGTVGHQREFSGLVGSTDGDGVDLIFGRGAHFNLRVGDGLAVVHNDSGAGDETGPRARVFLAADGND